MTIRAMEYQLDHGYIHNWLVAGPQGWAGCDSPGEVWQQHLPERQRQAELCFEQTPVDRGKTGDNLTWRYTRCSEDHLVNVSSFVPNCQAVLSWAYTRLAPASPGDAVLHLSLMGYADLWLNGTAVFHSDAGINPSQKREVTIPVHLDAENELLLCLGKVGVRSVALWAAVRVEGTSLGEAVVKVPSSARFPHRFVQFESLFDHAYLEEAASYRGKVVNLRFGEGAGSDWRYAYSIQDASSMIYVEGTWDVDKEKVLDVGHPERIFERPGRVVLRAPGKEYFDQDMRYQRSLPLYILDNSYSSEPYGDYAGRRTEALMDAARRDGLLFAEPAKMILEKWEQLDLKAIAAAVRQVAALEAGSELNLVGLLGIVARFGDHPSFPKNALDGLEEAVLAYQFTAGDSRSGVDYDRESSQILLAAAAVLAGQQYPQKIFGHGGISGASLCEQGEAMALDWMRRRGQTGFAEWDSPEAVERNIVALSHLVSLAESETVRDFSAVLLDKILFLMAVNTFKGIYGGSMGSASACYESAGLKSGRMQASAGIARLLWGTGIYSAQLAGVVSIALSEYDYPSFFANLALDQAEIWSKERHQLPAGEVNKVVYRTGDAMLGSVQDFRPGQSGTSEHTWQATLGPDALVFVNHPASFNQESYSQPGFWLGNDCLPRVAQWKEALVAIYNLPEDSVLGFTHAYFPMYAFDETVFEGGWAFARKNQGYLAVTASAGFELQKTAPDGYRELRSTARQNVWVCQVGNVEKDGNFLQFREKILKNKFVCQELSVELETAHGSHLAFDWQGAFKVNGQEVILGGFPHVDHPNGKAEFPAHQMDIEYGDTLFRLDFA